MFKGKAHHQPLADPDCVYVDSGGDFGRRYTVAHAEASRISFGSAVWALDYILGRGGSAYLPEEVAPPHVHGGVLHTVHDAAVLNRDRCLATNNAAPEAGRGCRRWSSVSPVPCLRNHFRSDRFRDKWSDH